MDPTPPRTPRRPGRPTDPNTPGRSGGEVEGDRPTQRASSVRLGLVSLPLLLKMMCLDLQPHLCDWLPDRSD